MLILTLRTDKPEAELGLYEDEKLLTSLLWEAHRQLAETVHSEIREVLTSQDKVLKDVEGIVVYQGPGSFTGLRIGISVANTLADSLQIAIVGAQDSEWVSDGIQKLRSGENEGAVSPHYGAAPRTTEQKK